jgi:D-glycero-D-manno-heptose 1,7-bisphosphate phosphatase
LTLTIFIRPEQVVFVDGIFRSLAVHAYGLDYRIVVMSLINLALVRGYFSEDDFHALTVWMKNIFSQQGCPITAVYFCPYHPTAGLGDYRRDSSWRKPAPGMILAAAQDLDLDLANSILVGDRLRDIAAGEAAGVRCNLLYGESVDDNSEVRPTARVSSLREIRPYLL